MMREPHAAERPLVVAAGMLDRGEGLVVEVDGLPMAAALG
jgi:hypothetical protein